MLSLRRRVMIGGAASAVVSIVIGTLAIYTYIDGKVLQRFDTDLTDRHTQLVVGLSDTADAPEQLIERLFDPAYSTPFSGSYWQVTRSDGQIYTSPSLFETTLPAPTNRTSGDGIRDSFGPEGEPVRSMHQTITLEDNSVWSVTVAESHEELSRERSETQRSLLLVFAFIGMVGLAGALLQVSAVLTPLQKLRHDVAHRWDRGEDLSSEDYPEEVAPLVDDLDALLKRNREVVDRARRQAADLAHALKTPTAILRNELSVLAENNHDIDKAMDALDRVDAQLGRSLARIRAANSGASNHARTDLSNSVNRFSRLFSTMAERDGKVLQTQADADLSVRMDKQDIEEVLGNLLDNALKWAKGTVALTAHEVSGGIEMLIEDDGPGIPEGAEREALRSGGRLDSSKPGTGLGLAIAVDLLHAYGANLVLEKSKELGGLAVKIMIPNKATPTTV